MVREFLEDLVLVADSGLRAMTGNHQTKADLTVFPTSAELSEKDRQTAASLMRINHCGEVCAQALYEGQALTSHTAEVRHQLKQAAQEEREHLALCRGRLKELDARPSVLEPLFFVTSIAIGAIAGRLGDKVGLGFVEATEDEVCKHLDRHIQSVSGNDPRTKTILETIRADEAKHQQVARERGGTVFAKPIKSLMGLAAKVMTRTTAHI